MDPKTVQARTELPHATLRFVDPDISPAPTCGRCDEPAVIHFDASYTVTSMTPPLKTAFTAVHLYGCQTHLGELTFAAAYTVTAGPTGAV